MPLNGVEQGTPSLMVDTSSRANIGGMLGLVEYFSGGPGSQSVDRFFDCIEEAGKLGLWTEEHQAGVTRLRLKGDAHEWLEGEIELKSAPYPILKKALINRFQIQDTSVHRAQQLLQCVQKPGESVQQYATRLKIAGRQTLIVTDREAENTVRRQVLEETLLGQYVKGLRGEIKRFVLYADPLTFKDAIAIAAREEKNEVIMNGRRQPTVMAVQQVTTVPTPSIPVAPVHTTTPAMIESDIYRSRNKCTQCRGMGHYSQECATTATIAWPSKRGTGNCFNCNQAGHLKASCPHPPKNVHGQVNATGYANTAPPQYPAPPPFSVPPPFQYPQGYGYPPSVNQGYYVPQPAYPQQPAPSWNNYMPGGNKGSGNRPTQYHGSLNNPGPT